MEVKLDVQRLESYSQALSEKLCNDFFSKNTIITGQQILEFTAVEQVNYFVIKNLLDKWKEETTRLESPYFDYNSAEVKEAMKNLMNKLSKCIAVKKEFFKPLLQKAIFDTLQLLISPYFFLKNDYLLLTRDIIKIEDLKEKQKYVRINRGLVSGLLEKIGNNNEVTSEVAIREFTLVKNSSADEDLTVYADSFSRMLSVDIKDFTIKPNLEMVVEKPVEEKKPVLENIIKENQEVVHQETSQTLNKKLQNSQLTLNDILSREKGTGLVEQHQKTKISDLKAEISLNQKFLFSNALFGGSQQEFVEAVDELQKCESFDSAKNLMDNHYAIKYKWAGNEYLKDFTDLIKRKFL